MSESNWSKFLEKLKALYKNIEEFDVEEPYLIKALNALKQDYILRELYSFKEEDIEPRGVGGAGIVIKVTNTELEEPRAIKIPRPKPHLLNVLCDSIKNEMSLLTRFKNENIITIYHKGEVDIDDPIIKKYPFYIMDFFYDPIDLKKYINQKLENCHDPIKAREILQISIDRFYEIAKALKYMHSYKFLHFDVKPSNILIGDKEQAILGDLGYTKQKTTSEEKVLLVFTRGYAHKDLDDKQAEDSGDSNRARTMKFSPSEFRYEFDINAFGRSILEILQIILNKVDCEIFDYNFVYLHLMACRMLDGNNEINSVIDKSDRKFFKESWFELNNTDFKNLRYKSFDTIVEDFEKLLFKDKLISKIPELNPFEPKRVQCIDGIPAPFTDRVKKIVEHPVFERLAYVPQLGLIRYIYPTATHNRLEHSMGTFRNSCLYVNSLYNDSFNPLFRQLVNEEYLKCLLISSLLHDLGHYPLEHEISEVIIDDRFNHHDITLEFLENQIEDLDSHTLKQIIYDEETNIWNADIGIVKGILCQLMHGEDKKKEIMKQNGIQDEQIPLIKMLSSIIDGPIDADKLDYLVRDSENCFLNYGKVIDFDRLVRNLTILISKNKDNPSDFKLGTYTKGKSTAESFGFARYLLYQSVYWHHTSRAIRVMLNSAVEIAYAGNKKNDFIKDFIKDIGTRKKTVSEKKLDINSILTTIGKYSRDEEKGERENKLIKMIKDRNYYKRILTILSNDKFSKEEYKDDKFTLLSGYRYALTHTDNFQDTLRKKILREFEKCKEKNLIPNSIDQSKRDRTSEILQDPYSILCDCPDPSYGTQEILEFIPDPKVIQSIYIKSTEMGKMSSDFWDKHYKNLMLLVAKGRLFCHPEIRNVLLATIGQEKLRDIIEKILIEKRIPNKLRELS